MEKNVIISIKGIQAYENQDSDAIELVTEGRLTDLGGDNYHLSYQESELTGLGGTLTTFQIEPGCITLLRVGEVNSQMVFQMGQRHLSMYETPYGALSVGVRTKKMKSTITSDGGDIEINYAIEIDHAMAGENIFQINVKEAKPGIIKQ